jgi:hypothetical protein
MTSGSDANDGLASLSQKKEDITASRKNCKAELF